MTKVNYLGRAPALILTPPGIRYKPRTDFRPTIFLAGSIEMGKAVDWQALACEYLADYASIIFNPRRPDWNSSWTQSIEHPEFNAQVNWELDRIEQADYVIFMFDPATMSPITLMELGIVSATKPKSAFVCCPDGFWRKGNIDILCERNGIRDGYDTFQDLMDAMISHIRGTKAGAYPSSEQHRALLAARKAEAETKAEAA